MIRDLTKTEITEGMELDVVFRGTTGKIGRATFYVEQIQRDALNARHRREGVGDWRDCILPASRLIAALPINGQDTLRMNAAERTVVFDKVAGFRVPRFRRIDPMPDYDYVAVRAWSQDPANFEAQRRGYGLYANPHVCAVVDYTGVSAEQTEMPA
jgi:hypothetical protein